MMASDEITRSSFMLRLFRSFSRIWSSYLDKTTVYVGSRWLCLAALLSLYITRVFLLNGFYVVTYGLGIYLLSLFIGFLSPKLDPEVEGFVLPVRDEEEYRPFQRRLPEFKFWFSASKSIGIAMIMTFFPIFDLPVFWPILLVYFILLFILTMKQQIRKMIRYKYIPFSWGKQTYGDITRRSTNTTTTSTTTSTSSFNIGGGGGGDRKVNNSSSGGGGGEMGGGGGGGGQNNIALYSSQSRGPAMAGLPPTQVFQPLHVVHQQQLQNNNFQSGRQG